MQILKSKKVFIGMILITLLMSLSVLSAENPDNTTTSQVSTQTNNDNTDHKVISTNTKEEQKNDNIDLNSKSKTKTEKEYRPDMAWIYEIDPTFPDPDVGQFDIKDDEEYIYENDSSKEVKNTETNNKIYTISNITQLRETLNDIITNQSEEYNYILNIKDGQYRFEGEQKAFINISTTKKLNITINGSSFDTELFRGAFIIAPSVKLTLSNIYNSHLSLKNYGTCILDNFTNKGNNLHRTIHNLGKMSIKNSNITLRIEKYEERCSWYYTGKNDFYIYVKGGLNNEGILEIENTTFNNSCTEEITRFIEILDPDDKEMNYETADTSGECNCKGGLIYNNNNGTIIINNTTFTNNIANACSYPSDAYGGVIYNMGNMSINNSIFRNNTVKSYGEGYGGAIYNIGNLNITKTVFSEMKINNSHKPKGLIIYNNGTLNVTSSVLSSKNNETMPLIYSENPNVTVENNWWGSNNPEWTRLLKNVETPENWIYLRVQVSKDNLISTEEMEITYDFNWLTNGNKTVQSQGNMPDNTVVSGKSERGEISENTTRNGNTQTTYTAVKQGIDNLKVPVEENEVQIPINITITPIASITKITTITKNVSVNEELEIEAEITDINNQPANIGYVIIKIDGITQKNPDQTNIEVPVENGTIKYTIKIDDKFNSKIHNLTLKYMPNEQYTESSSSAVFNLSKPTYPIINVNSYTAFANALNKLKQQTLNPYSIATINFTRGNYNLTQTLNWQNATYKILRMYGNGNLIDANHKQFITVAEGYTLELYNFKIRYAQSERGSVIYNNHGTINIYDSIFLNSTATKNGGVIYNDHGKVKILNSSFSNNVAENGAVIYNNNGFINETKSYFSFNTANRGGVNYNIGETIIIKSTYKNNNAKINGGVNFNDKNKITITNSTFLNNKATKNGGCNYNNVNTTLNITETQITNNTAENGGANYNYGNLIIKSSKLNQNKATFGGCNYNYGSITIRLSNLNQNMATRGGVNYNHNDLKISKSIFKNNQVTINAAVNYNDHGKIDINNSTFIENTAKQDGGCNYNNNGNMTINNTKNTYNMANRGAINYNLKGTLIIENTNTTTKNSNINYNEEGTMKNKNSDEIIL